MPFLRLDTRRGLNLDLCVEWVYVEMPAVKEANQKGSSVGAPSADEKPRPRLGSDPAPEEEIPQPGTPRLTMQFQTGQAVTLEGDDAARAHRYLIATSSAL